VVPQVDTYLLEVGLVSKYGWCLLLLEAGWLIHISSYINIPSGYST